MDYGEIIVFFFFSSVHQLVFLCWSLVKHLIFMFWLCMCRLCVGHLFVINLMVICYQSWLCTNSYSFSVHYCFIHHNSLGCHLLGLEFVMSKVIGGKICNTQLFLLYFLYRKSYHKVFTGPSPHCRVPNILLCYCQNRSLVSTLFFPWLMTKCIRLVTCRPKLPPNLPR